MGRPASLHHGIYTLITSLSDIDECSTSVGSCRGDQECVNTIGSYMCAAVCRRGFKRSKDGQQCIGMFAFFFRFLSLNFMGFTQIEKVPEIQILIPILNASDVSILNCSLHAINLKIYK